MHLKSKLVAATLAVCSLTTLQAQATTITFEDLVAGAVLSNQYAGLGVTFSANAFTGPNTNSTTQGWATNTTMTLTTATAANASATLGTPALVSGNVLRLYSGWLAENGDPSFLISFSTPVDSFSIDFAGVTGSNAAFTDVKIFAYNGATLLATVSGINPAPSAVSQFTLSYAAAAITSVAVAPGSYGDFVVVDNVTFTPSAVPEAQTYALFLAGLAAMGALVRRQRRAA